MDSEDNNITESLEEQRMRLTAEGMVKSSELKDQLLGSLYLSNTDIKRQLKRALSKLWTEDELDEKIRAKHLELCTQCVFKRSIESQKQAAPKKERTALERVITWATSPTGTMLIVILVVITYAAATNGIHLGSELKALPGVSRLEK